MPSTDTNRTNDLLTSMRLGPPTHPPPRPSPPVVANFPSQNLVVGCGVAIFHVASARVVLCYHSRDKYWFLPKGRRDAGEETQRAAEREGFEEASRRETTLPTNPSSSLQNQPKKKKKKKNRTHPLTPRQSGYRNRLLPLPIAHRQPPSHHSQTPAAFSVEPLWTQLVPATARTQYVLFWYAAETLPPELEREATAADAPYAPPPPYPADLPLTDRVRREGPGYEPPRHEGTGVDAEEALYESCLVPVGEAERRLRGSVMADVVRRGWEGVLDRLALEVQVEERSAEGEGPL